MSKTTRRIKSPDALISLDYGGSATKSLYTRVDGRRETEFLGMEPYTAQVSQVSIENYQNSKLGCANPEDAAWVAVGDVYYAVGRLARTEFGADEALDELKYERAVEKTLAAIWVIQQRLKLDAKFSIALAVVLPPSEYQDRDKFKRDLKDALANYLTPTARLSVTLDSFTCRQEGSGIYMCHRQAQGEALKKRVCALVMLGYRNASILVAERGEVKTSRVAISHLGFYQMIKMVHHQTSGLSTHRLAPAICAAGVAIKREALRPLLRSRRSRHIEEELAQIVTAIRESRLEYSKKLIDWIDSKLPVDVEELVFAGGTADYLAKELSQHYAHLRLSWNADTKVPEFIDTEGYGNRILDVLGVYLNAKKQLNKQLRAMELETV